jgi:hypothetical protein
MLADIRLALLISLTVLVLVLAYKWFKRRTVVRDMPVPIHAQLVSVEVMYHPMVLRVEVEMPCREELFPAMLSEVHAMLHQWPAMAVGQGRHILELPLSADPGRTYYLELATANQRTERRFTIRSN